MTTFVYSRDASWWNSPNTRAPKRWHLLRSGNHYVAKCSSMIQLDIDSGRLAIGVQKTALCMRCFDFEENPEE